MRVPRAAGATRDYETTALIDALGDFLLFMQRESALRRAKSRRKTASPSRQDADEDLQDKESKRAVFAWLKALSDSEWVSLWTVVDAGFVKTVLMMGMAAKSVETESGGLRKRRRGCAVQSAAPSITQFQLVPQDAVTRRLSSVAAATQPREFLRRPVVVTRDGDTLSGFHSQAFVNCCAWLVHSLCVLNTERSCDTLTLATEVGGKISRAEWLSRLDVVAGGNFMLRRPATRTAQQQHQQSQPSVGVWEQTAWFASRAYFAIAELIVNHIEIGIWNHWNESQKSPSYRIPRQGLVVKQLLADEWRLGTAARQQQALTAIGFQVGKYLKQLTPPSSRATMSVALTTLKEVVDAWSDVDLRDERLSARSLFSLPLSKVLALPHAGAVSLLVAELLQGQCAAMLSESLAKSLETNDESSSPGKSTHAQRRRAARKKTVKQRKHELESRSHHKSRLHAVLVELVQAVRVWQVRIEQVVGEVLTGIVDCVVAANVELDEDDSRDEELEEPVEDVANRSKRRKKRGKKKNKQKSSEETATELTHQAKENMLPNGGEYSLAMQRPGHPRPLISFLANGSDDMVYTTPPRHPVSSFNSHPFYPMASSPFFLQLSAQPHQGTFGPHLPSTDEQDHGQERGFERGEEEEERSVGSPTAASNENSSAEHNFDWYLPSLFSSSQSSVHTTSTVSSLDWDFQRWSMKTETNAAAAPVSINTKLRPLLKAPVRDSPVAPAVEDTSSSESNFPLPSFSSFIDISSEASSKSTSTSPIADIATDADDAARSDFLYREGGFFDRQRGSKRRRRPFPFEYDDDDDEDDEEGDEADVQSATGRRSRHRSWEDRASVSSGKSQTSERSTASTVHSASCACNKTASVADSDQEEPLQSAASTRLAERIAKLEGLLDDRLAKFDKETAAMSAEVSGLQQQVSLLSQRVKSLEAELEETRRSHSDGNADPSVNAAVSPPLAAIQPPQEPFSQTAVVPTVQAYPHPIMRPGGASNFSILGPFVSVPMSVLPPRSKLHWDMCEYVSQLQADSTARVSAQMAAIRLCTSAVQSLWPRAQVRPYGSFVTRLALPTSDVDLVICLPKVRRDAPADAAGVLEGRNAIKESWQQNLARKLTQEPWVVPDSVKTIPHAAIPIITLITKLPFKVRLDISFEGPGHNGLATNDVVLSLIHEFPPLAPVMLVLKSFVIERGFAVAYSGGLSSYALLLMVARYLQEHTDRYDNTSQASASSCADFGMVLMGLLDFYGNRFEPRTTGISVAARCFFDRDSIVASHHHHPHHQYASGGHATNNTAVMHSVDDAQDHWQQVHQSSHMHSANLLSSPGSRRHNNRATLNDWPMQRSHYPTIPDATATASHDPHKFDPLFIEDPLHASNNVGRNCFRISQIRRAFASGYTTLMAASMSAAVASESRSAVVGGVALHPDNILRSILGPSTPSYSSNGTTTPAVSVKNESTNTPAPVMYQQAKPRASQHHVPQNGARLGPAIMHLYDQQHVPVGYGNGGGAAYYPGNAANAYGGAGAAAAPPPYMLHRMQQQQYQQQYQQYPQQAYQQQYYPVSKPQTRPAEPSGPTPSSSATYRRHSGSVSEQMTTRSEAASSSSTDKYYVKRSKPVDRSLALSPRLIPPTMQRSSSIELDKKAMSASSSGNASTDMKSSTAGRGLTRKCPSRSMSFADVVMSGASSAVSAVKVEQKKAPSSPLTLAPTSSRRRQDATAEDAFNERLETKDDFELK